MKVVSGSMPGNRHVGELLLAGMLKELPEVDLCFFAVTSIPGVEHPEQYKLVLIVPPLELLHRAELIKFRAAFNSCRRIWTYERFARRTALQFKSVLMADELEPVWIIADSTAVIDCAYYAYRQQSFPFRLQVWDDVRHLAAQKHLDALSTSRVFKRFRFLLTRAKSVAVIGEQMADEYMSLGAKECVIIRHGLEAVTNVPALRPPTETFRIGFCGSAYASDAWSSLLKALDRMQWTILSRPVELCVVGSEANFVAGQPIVAKFWGRRSVAETARLMGECDLLYMPQSFQPNHDALSRWSFPTKLSTYVATGRAVFYHTPRYGSLVSFANQHGFNLVCDSLNPADVSQVLSRLETEPSLLESEGEVSARVANTVLSHAEFRRQTRRFLGLEN